MPLVSALAPAPETPANSFRLKIVPRPPTNQPFTPVIVPSAETQVPSLPDLPAAVPATECETEPVFTLQRDGERIVKIQIRCTCGQDIELRCLY